MRSACMLNLLDSVLDTYLKDGEEWYRMSQVRLRHSQNLPVAEVYGSCTSHAVRRGRRCEVKVIDLGSSCFTTDQLSSYVQSRSYRAPEVILGLPYGPGIDVWSLGCILAELLSGYVLFQARPWCLAALLGLP